MSNSRWSLRNIYLYLVCLITLVMVIVATVGLIRNAVELVYPDPGAYMERVPPDQSKDPDFDEEYWEEQQELQRQSQQRWAVLSLVGNFAMLIVAGPLYVYHWRKIESEPKPLESANAE